MSAPFNVFTLCKSFDIDFINICRKSPIMNTNPVVVVPAASVAKQAIDTASDQDALENLMTFLPIGSIRASGSIMYVMADGSAVVIDSTADGRCTLAEVAGCGGKVVQSDYPSAIVTATATGGKAIANGASSLAVAMGKGAMATALSNASVVAVGHGHGKVGRNGRAISTTKAGILRGEVGSVLRWADDDLVGGFLEITVGHGEYEACPNKDYGLGRNCNQWVITRTTLK